jgi:hypothetical protein
MGRGATRERYARALERFWASIPEKSIPMTSSGPQSTIYVQTRFADGASVATIRLEFTAIRGFGEFMADVQAFRVFFNVAKGIKVRSRKVVGKIDPEEVVEAPKF